MSRPAAQSRPAQSPTNAQLPREPSAREAEADLARASRAQIDAAGALLAAELDYDATQAEQELNALIAAREHADRAELVLQSAERRLQAARSRAAAETRAGLEAQRERLLADLGTQTVESGGRAFALAEAKAIIALAEARARRIEYRQRLAAKHSELAQVRKRLGEDLASGIRQMPDGTCRSFNPNAFDTSSLAIRPQPVLDELEALKPGASELARQLAEGLEPDLDSYDLPRRVTR